MMSHINVFGFWLFASTMFVFSILNFIVLITIMSALKMSPYSGLEFFESFKMPINIVKFFGNIDFEDILLKQNILESFQNQAIEITVTDSSFRATIGNNEQFEIDENGTTFRAVEKFFIGNSLNLSETNLQIESLNSMETDSLLVNNIKSPVNEDLFVNSDGNIWLKGAENFKIHGRNVVFETNQYIKLKSMTRDVIFDAYNGIFLNFRNFFDADLANNNLTASYKLCICKKNAKIFKMPVVNAIENCSFFAQC